ncbi:universal stress protein [Rhizobium sp. WYJ-E13]|uniref:universal stress protein n=1 Tax=Rhizobium sp. WYJ-E13 TaxID=2849093 RepID=UPI001C1EA725|nr:universal stress protein [Rhizobium sp. WYJ-E13]QWW71621.1 universal stress protein [Rhizobium sp. WYJ-E13]
MQQHFFLPLLTYPDDTSEFMIANGVALARHMKSSLTACTVEIAIPHVSPALGSLIVDTAKLTQEAEALSRQRGSFLARKTLEEAKAASVDIRMRNMTAGEPFVADMLAEAARAYDLVLLEAAGLYRPVVEAVLFESGRPLVLYPRQSFGGRIDHVAIAWDGSAAAASAVHNAAPFIEHASKVHLVCVTDEKIVNDEAGDHLIENFRRSGVAAEMVRVHAADRPIGDVLQTQAFELRADLLVMGGFGHSRLREFVLGGATKSVLTNVLLPVLLSH